MIVAEVVAAVDRLGLVAGELERVTTTTVTFVAVLDTLRLNVGIA